jgi:hypothetical protein
MAKLVLIPFPVKVESLNQRADHKKEKETPPQTRY